MRRLRLFTLLVILLLTLIQLFAAPSAACASGTPILFEDWGEEDIFTLIPGEERVNVSRSSDIAEMEPLWSPDKSLIAFSTRSIPQHLYVMHSDGSKRTRLTTSPQEEGDFSRRAGGMQVIDGYDWSPDGRKLVYSFGVQYDICTRGRDRSFVAVVNRDGTGRKLLTGTRSEAQWPSWAPDGQHIVFRKNPRDEKPGLFVMNADGSRHRRLLSYHSTFWPMSRVSWSPDGRFLVVDHGTMYKGDIYIMRADGTKRRQLTWYEGDDVLPRWSPDGRWIAYMSTHRSDGYNLFIKRPDGSDKRLIARRVAMSSHGAFFFDWAPSSKRIVFESRNPDAEVSGGAYDQIDLFVTQLDPRSVRLLLEAPYAQILPDW